MSEAIQKQWLESVINDALAVLAELGETDVFLILPVREDLHMTLH